MKNSSSNILITLTLVASIIFTSCSTKNQATDSTTENLTVITLWHYYNGSTKERLDSLILEFNESIGINKGIVIDAYSYSSVNELSEAVLASGAQEVGAPPMPDIFAAYSDNAFILDNLGIVADLTPYFTEEELSLYRSEFIEEGRFSADNSLKIIPVAKSSEALYINETDIMPFFEETGNSFADLSTWESLIQTSKEYYDYTDEKTPEPNDGKALFGVDSLPNFIIISSMQLGDPIFKNENGKVGFSLSEENARKIWETLYVPYIKGYFASYGRFRTDDIKSGDLLTYVGSTASTSYFPTTLERSKDVKEPIECVVMPYPTYENGDLVAIQQGAGMVVSKSDEEHERKAVEFLKWFTAPENNMEFAVSTGYMPVQNESLNFDNIIELVNANDVVSSASVSATETLYKTVLNEYYLYSTPPFEGSYEVRFTIETDLHDFIQEGVATVGERIGQGEDKDAVVADLTSEENFIKWYTNFNNMLNGLL